MNRYAAAMVVLAGFSAAFCVGQEPGARADPSKGFFPSPSEPAPSRGARSAPVALAKTIQAATVIPLPQHGNGNGGADRGYTNAGIIFGARIYGGNLVNAIELFYYIPSQPDHFYREGDYRASTGRIGSDGGSELGGFYCPDGYAAAGVQGAAGLGVDRVGLVCAKIGELSQEVPLPVLGGKGGDPFRDMCDRTYSTGYLTGVRIRSGAWMDAVQGLCQAKEEAKK